MCGHKHKKPLYKLGRREKMNEPKCDNKKISIHCQDARLKALCVLWIIPILCMVMRIYGYDCVFGKDL